ncbi:MAG: CmcJ/NvfI family oxidoreductase [Acidimicrobiales bacterium]
MTEFCRAELFYAPRVGPPLEGLQPVTVPILDGRSAALPGWQTCGLELVDAPASVGDWTDDDRIASHHYADVEALAVALTGADAALVSDHVKRTAESTKRPREQSPVRLVHSDFAAGYHTVVQHSYREVGGRGAKTLERSGLTAEQIEAAPRVIMMQFWRNIGPAKMDLPMAFCDARSVTPAEGRPFPYTGYVAGGRSFDALAIATPERADQHDWYTFPEMAVDEVVAFRTYDTELVDAGQTHFLPHSAFPDPEVAAGQPARFSVELRVMCLFL